MTDHCGSGLTTGDAMRLKNDIQTPYRVWTNAYIRFAKAQYYARSWEQWALTDKRKM